MSNEHPHPVSDDSYGLNLELNSVWIERYGPEARDAYVQAVLSTAEQTRGASRESVVEALKRSFADASVPIDDAGIDRLAGQLAEADGPITITSDRGDVLGSSA